MKFFGIYLVIINLIGFFLMGYDKERAIHSEWRVSEACLFGAALLGGGFGSTLGMWLFRHKTRHWYFVIGMPLITVAELILFLILR